MITTIPDRERALQAQVDALTAELARLRAVEPFGWFYDITNGDQKQGPIWQGGEDRKITEIVAEDIGAKVFPLYRAAPPAQPAEPVQPGWRDIESAPKDELILVGPTKRMGVCVAMHHSRDGWVTETCSEWMTIYTPTRWMPLPPAPKATK